MMRADNRLQQLKAELDDLRVDALLVGHLPNVRYLCGFTGSAGLLVISGRDATFFTDSRYTEQAREEVKGARIRIQTGKSAFAAALDWLSRHGSVRRLGIEAAYMTVSD